MLIRSNRLQLYWTAIGVLLASCFFTSRLLMALGGESKISDDYSFKGQGLPPAAVKASKQADAIYRVRTDLANSIYFKGQTSDLNEFLSTLSGVKLDKPLQAIFVRGSGRRQIQPMNNEQDAEELSYNWVMTLPMEIPFGKNAGKSDEDLNVVIHLDESIVLDDIRLPLAFEAKVGGQLGRFVRYHNKRHQQNEPNRGASIGSKVDRATAHFK